MCAGLPEEVVPSHLPARDFNWSKPAVEPEAGFDCASARPTARAQAASQILPFRNAFMTILLCDSVCEPELQNLFESIEATGPAGPVSVAQLGTVETLMRQHDFRMRSALKEFHGDESFWTLRKFTAQR